MENKIEIKMLFETLLSAPGMSDSVKLDVKLSRQTALLLATAVRSGLSSAATSSTLLSFADREAIGELEQLMELVLEKAGLTQTCQKLQALQA